MAEPEKDPSEVSPSSSLAKKANELMTGSGSSVSSLSDVNSLVETLMRADELQGARKERAEKRDYNLKIMGGVALVTLLLGFVFLTPEKDRPEQVKLVLAALIAAIPTGFAAFFAGKNTKKD